MRRPTRARRAVRGAARRTAGAAQHRALARRGNGARRAHHRALVGAAEGRRLNRDFRGRDYPTNVLTFVYSAARGGALEGDIVLCAPVIAREARAQGVARRARYAHLAVHGALHLQGYDHERGRDAARMEARERSILARLGFGDPYGRRAA